MPNNAFNGDGEVRTARLPSSAASTNATVALDRPCALRHIVGYNSNAAGRFLKIYALDATLAAPDQNSTPFLTLYLPPSSGFAFDFDAVFNFGCGYRLCTGAADNDNTAVGSGDILGLNLIFA